jgi:hypothetical protein
MPAWLELVALMLGASAIVIGAALVTRANRAISEEWGRVASARLQSATAQREAQDALACANEFLPTLGDDLEPGDPR